MHHKQVGLFVGTFDYINDVIDIDEFKQYYVEFRSKFESYMSKEISRYIMSYARRF